jgi:4-amino-4-deoxy-L-arabinose transferase-like glycosyltransferase
MTQSLSGENAEESSCTSPHSVTARELALLAIVGFFSLFTAVVPFCRAFYRVAINYNEGWNVYVASALTHHFLLYPSRYSWTTVNYPIGSFYVASQLSKLTGDYLFTARVLSLLGLALSCILVGAITKRITGASIPAFLSACFCLALFCANANQYVGMDDPQMVAQVFFLAGVLLYVSRRAGAMWLPGVALLFALGGTFKHNLIDLPLAVLLDLCFVSGRRALQFLIYGVLFLSAAVALNIHVGGPFFIACLLTPRLYSFPKAVGEFVKFYGVIQLPLLATAIAVAHAAKNASSRVISIWFVASLILGIAFAGGSGVSVNTFFSNFLSMSVLVGIFIGMAWTTSLGGLRDGAWLRVGLPLVLFGSLLFPLQTSVSLRPTHWLRKIRMQQETFERDVSFLRSKQGPVICEDLLRCYFAGKPYVYDPFNSTSLIESGKLDGGEIISKIEKQEYGAIQLIQPVELEIRPNDHFIDPIFDAISKYYIPVIEESDSTIYVPKQHQES